MGTLVAFVLTALSHVAIFAPLERAFPARPQPIRRPELGLDVAFFAGQYLLWNGLVVLGLRWVEGHTRLSLGASLPWWLQAVLAVVLGDLCVYWFHRASHSFEPLWRLHRVHHTAERLDFVAAFREHPVDGLLTQLAANLPAFLLGFSMGELAAFVVFRGLWAIFIHSNTRVPLGPLRWVLGAPELHHWHHAAVEPTRHNFANLAPWLDVLFGTHHLPDDQSYSVGTGAPLRGYFRSLVSPLRR